MRDDWKPPFDFLRVSDEAIRAMNERCVRQFNETVARVEAEDTEQKIRQLLGDTLGMRTYMVPEAETLSEGLK